MNQFRVFPAVSAAAAGWASMILNFSHQKICQCNEAPSPECKYEPMPEPKYDIRQSQASSLQHHHPVSPIRIFSPHPDLDIAFDVRTRTPLYVLERLHPRTQNAANARDARRRHFYEESSLPVHFRSRNQHYKHTSFDRGHMAPAADFANSKATYNLINVAPQDPVINRGVWNRLEGWVRRVADHSDENTDEVYAITGPLWLPRERDKLDQGVFWYHFPAIGEAPSLVSVPTHWFKVIVVLKKEKSDIGRNHRVIDSYACFVIPNDSAQVVGRKSLLDFLVPWQALEAVSGLEFFRGARRPTNRRENSLQMPPIDQRQLDEGLLHRQHLCVKHSCS